MECYQHPFSSRYSEDFQELLHRSRVYLPAKVAALLDAKPNLISAAVTAFFHRDIIDTKICRKMEHFPPEDIVLRSVTFTKFSYAMLSHDRSNPERNRWNLPPFSDPHYKEYLLGYKIVSWEWSIDLRVLQFWLTRMILILDERFWNFGVKEYEKICIWSLIK